MNINSDYEEFNRLIGQYDSLSHKRAPDLRDCSKMWRGYTPDHYLWNVYRTFHIKGVNVFVDFKEFVNTSGDLPFDEFIGELWAAYREAAQVSRRTKGKGCLSLEGLFVDLFMDSHDLHGRAERSRVTKLFYVFLAGQCGGHVAEWETFHHLSELSDVVVYWAPAEDESKDIDLYVASASDPSARPIAVSVKNFKAFNAGTIEKYRSQGRTKPELYVNNTLDHYDIPPKGGPRLWGAHEIQDTVDDLLGQ